MDKPSPDQSEGILLLAPIGRDAELAASVIAQAGLLPIPCRNLDELVGEMSEIRGAMLIAEEALAPSHMPRFLEALGRQPPWSDIPIVLLTSGGMTTSTSRRALDLLGPHGDVTLLERPIRILTLTSTLQAALRARRRQFQVRDLLQQREDVLASILDAFSMLDHDWRYTFVNPVAAELCRMPAEQMLGKTIWELFPGTVGSEMETHLRRVMRDRVGVNFEWRNDRWGRWFSIRAYPSSGGISLFTIEITDRKRTELELERVRREAIEANRAKDQFLAALSHELRTPLNPVLLSVSAMEGDPAAPEHIREELSMIHRQVQLEARLIDDLLDLTRVTRGKLILHRNTVDLHESVEHAIAACSGGEALSKRITVSARLHAAEHHGHVDPARFQQILWNLLNNAVKFSPEGGRIEVATRNPVAEVIEISVSDNGIGIDPDLLPRLFDAFEQGNASITRRFGGLGLGLAISKAIADLHEGSLKAASPGRGGGAVFTLRLHTVPAPQARSLRPSGPPVREMRLFRILLAEDHEPTRRVLSRLLSRAGHHVRAAGAVEEALALAREHAFDLVVSDLGLPDASGLDLMRRLQADYGLRGIALSGYGMDGDVKASAAAGFAVHLTKPVDWKQLERALAHIAGDGNRPDGEHSGDGSRVPAGA